MVTGEATVLVQRSHLPLLILFVSHDFLEEAQEYVRRLRNEKVSAASGMASHRVTSVGSSATYLPRTLSRFSRGQLTHVIIRDTRIRSKLYRYICGNGLYICVDVERKVVSEHRPFKFSSNPALHVVLFTTAASSVLGTTYGCTMFLAIVRCS